MKKKRYRRKPEECTTRQRERERDDRYEPIRTDPENDPLQILTDGEIPQGGNSINIRRSNRNINKPNRYGSVPYQGNSYM